MLRERRQGREGGRGSVVAVMADPNQPKRDLEMRDMILMTSPAVRVRGRGQPRPPQSPEIMERQWIPVPQYSYQMIGLLSLDH